MGGYCLYLYDSLCVSVNVGVCVYLCVILSISVHRVNLPSQCVSIYALIGDKDIETKEFEILLSRKASYTNLKSN